MKIFSVGIAAIILPCLFSDHKILHAADSNENTDELLKGSAADDIPEFPISDESNHEVADGETHGGQRNLLFWAKKNAKRAEAELHNLLGTTAIVQNELEKQGAIQMRLAEELRQQKVSRIPQETIHYHYEFDDSISKNKYNSANFLQSKAPYFPPIQKQAGNNFMPLTTQPVIDFPSKDYSYSPVATPIYGSKDNYALPDVYESSSSIDAAYVPVKYSDAYYKNLWNQGK